MSSDDSQQMEPAGVLRGIPEATLRRALHDLSGPLNSISILSELLRAKLEGADRSGSELIDRISATIQQMGRMVHDVRRAATSMSTDACRDHDLTEALGRAAERAGEFETTSIDGADGLQVAAPPGQLDALLDCAYRCVAGGAASASWRAERAGGDGPDGRLLLRMLLAGDGVELPAVPARQHLVAAGDVDAAWFELSARLDGIGGSYADGDAGSGPVVAIYLPSPIRS